jgi:hypothetical protein
MTSDKPDLAPVFEKLKCILQKYQKGALNGTDKPGTYTLAGPPTDKTRGRSPWFGAVITQKRYVSYHLMPVYGCRELLENMSPGLKKRMQGKACFNFTSVDEPLFKELAALTDRGYRRFKELKYIA